MSDVISCSIIASSLIGFLYSVKQWKAVASVKLDGHPDDTHINKGDSSPDALQKMKEIGGIIQVGADAFLYAEYFYLAIFMVLFTPVVWMAAGKYAAIAFLLGCFTSTFSGWIGMKIAVFTNVRTTHQRSSETMLALCSSPLSFNAPVVAPATRTSGVSMMDVEGLKVQAKSLNPVVGFWDPLNLSGGEFWGDSNAATIGFLRESEIKHGRVAMAAFVGYIVHANDIRFPWKPFMGVDIGASPQQLWDNVPEVAKWQIMITIAFFEFWRENSFILEKDGQTHYMRGGKPGYMPTFDQLPHPVPFNLFDPFGFSKNASPEKKAKGLLAEVNNGRLAMLGIFGFLSESSVPGSVPGLAGVGIRPYDGNVMAPFDANFHLF